MAMNTNAAPGELAIDINTTPLIDVMLVLLTLLILTLPVQTHAVKLEMPHSDRPPSPSITVSVDFDGTTYWNGTAVTRQTLDTYFEQTGKQEQQPEIHLNSNPLARYSAVATVLGDAQRLGVTKIGFDGIDKYAN